MCKSMPVLVLIDNVSVLADQQPLQWRHINDVMVSQIIGNSTTEKIVNALDLLQSCTKPSICSRRASAEVMFYDIKVKDDVYTN